MNQPLSVDALLRMYSEYKTLLAEQKHAESTLARARLGGNDTTEAQQELNRLISQLQTLSDAMTFDTPRIWIEYKYRAYQNDPQPIATMHDLRLHCSKPDYICTKRFIFLNRELETAGKSLLSDRTAFPDKMAIGELLAQPTLDTLNQSTYESWREHEYHHDSSGAVAKWLDYKPS